MVTLKNIVYDEDNPNAIIDLINFNFDQLVKNGHGPIGAAGNVGTAGVTGVQGAVGTIGVTGSIGVVGSTGIAGSEMWVDDTTSVVNTNILKPIQLQTHSNLPNVVIGGDLTNNRAQLSVSRNLVDMASTLRLTNTPNNLDRFFDMTLDNGSMLMSFDVDSAASAITIQSNDTNLYDSVDSELFAKFSQNIVDFKKNTIIDRTVTLLSGARFESQSPAQDDIIVAIDETGKLGWADTTSLNSNVAMGSIVPILPSEIKAGNFEMSHNSNTANKTGRGIGLFSGWYICHGYTWFKNDVGGIPGKAYYTPRFNFDYGGKTLINKMYTSFKSGSSYLTTVIVPDAYSYNVGAKTHMKSVNWKVKVDESLTEGAHATASVHQNIVLGDQTHIVFLGRTDLTWRFVDVSSFTEKHYIYYVEAPINANGIYWIQLWFFSIPAFKIRSQMMTGTIGGSDDDDDNNIGPRILPSSLQVTPQKEFRIYQDSLLNSWIDTTKPIYESDGLLARKGWYGSNHNYSPPSGQSKNYGYWDGKEWYYVNWGTALT